MPKLRTRIGIAISCLMALWPASAAFAQKERVIWLESARGTATIAIHSEGLRSPGGLCLSAVHDVTLLSLSGAGIEVGVGVDGSCLVNIVYWGPASIDRDDGSAGDTQAYEFVNVSAAPSGSSKGSQALLSTSPDTCRSEFHRRDLANITLTGVNHETRWAYTGWSVSLQWFWTQLVWSAGTGWRVTSGPSHWIVDGNGGTSDRTHGEGSFQWYNNDMQHTLKVENRVNAKGTCQGFFYAIGEVPGTGFWHYSTVIYD